MPRKPQLSPHKCRKVKYGSKTHLTPEEDTSKPLNDAGIRRVQKIVGALLWIGRAVASVLKKHHDISQDWEGKKFAGIDLDWNYATKHCDRTCRLSMKIYIKNLLIKLNHPMPRKLQLSPHKCREVKYGSKNQLAPE